MSWSSPPTFTAGNTALSADVNLLSADLNALSTHTHTGVAGDGASTLGTGINLLLAGGLGLTGVISPTQLAANTDNYAPTSGGTSAVWRLSTDASRNLTGISISQTDGWVRILTNIGSNNLVLKHDVTSTAANRFYCPGAVDLTLGQYQSAIIKYDVTLTRWMVASISALTLSIAGPTSISDVTMTNSATYYDGPTLALTAGTWLILGLAQFNIGVGAAVVTIKLYYGSTPLAARAIQAPATQISGLIATIAVLASAQTVKLAAQSTSAGDIMKQFNDIETSVPGTAIMAVKVV